MMRKLCALAVAGGVLTAVPLAHGGHGDDHRGRDRFVPPTVNFHRSRRDER